jgi:hypothetical protein
VLETTKLTLNSSIIVSESYVELDKNNKSSLCMGAPASRDVYFFMYKSLVQWYFYRSESEDKSVMVLAVSLEQERRTRRPPDRVVPLSEESLDLWRRAFLRSSLRFFLVAASI